MLHRTRIVVAAGVFALASIWAAASIGALPATGRPEEVGLSSDRLKRIPATIQRHIDEGNISGAVTLVGRNGRVAHLQAHGYMNVAAKKPMPTNAPRKMRRPSVVPCGIDRISPTARKLMTAMASGMVMRCHQASSSRSALSPCRCADRMLR